MREFDQYMQHKVLSFKYSTANSPDKLVGVATVDDGKGGQRPAKLEDFYEVKNVCAKLHVKLVERLDNTLNLLEMSKREFIELALIEAMNRVDDIIEETGAVQFREDLSQ